MFISYNDVYKKTFKSNKKCVKSEFATTILKIFTDKQNFCVCVCNK